MNKSVPVVIFSYNRVESLSRVIDVVTQWPVPRIYIVIDGPKNQLDKSNCRSVVNLVKFIKKHHNVTFIQSKTNLGLRRRIVSGIDEIFRHEDSAIFLEDDCIPDLTFYQFASEMLIKYKNDKRIMSVAGFSARPSKKNIENSYYFSKYIESWGWATWKRAWIKYDDQMKDWPNKKSTNWLKTFITSKIENKYWEYIFDNVYNGRIKSWAYRWLYSCWKEDGLTIVPSTNLITNIGYGSSATNTKFLTNFKLEKNIPMNFPLNHPAIVEINNQADLVTKNSMFINFTIVSVILLKSVINIIRRRK